MLHPNLWVVERLIPARCLRVRRSPRRRLCVMVLLPDRAVGLHWVALPIRCPARAVELVALVMAMVLVWARAKGLAREEV